MRQRWFPHTEWVWRSSEGLWREDGKAVETLKVRGALYAVYMFHWGGRNFPPATVYTLMYEVSCEVTLVVRMFERLQEI